MQTEFVTQAEAGSERESTQKHVEIANSYKRVENRPILVQIHTRTDFVRLKTGQALKDCSGGKFGLE